ncbi:MAG: hypothetical protein U0168_16180 [Nannocystaceae bacterium]
MAEAPTPLVPSTAVERPNGRPRAASPALLDDVVVFTVCTVCTAFVSVPPHPAITIDATNHPSRRMQPALPGASGIATDRRGTHIRGAAGWVAGPVVPPLPNVAGARPELPPQS